MAVERYWISFSIFALLAIIFIGFQQADASPNQFNFVISKIAYQSSIGPFGANMSYVVTASNNGVPVSTLSCNPVSGTLFPVGDTPVTCVATDSQNSSATNSFFITVNGTDSVPPTITPPANVTASATGTFTNVTLGTPIVTDNVDTSPIVTNNKPTAGFPIGTTLVTWTATDHSGNSVTAIQQVTLTPPAPLTVLLSPLAGLYPHVLAVTLTTIAPSNIYYTIDGSTPTTLSAIYKNPISISSNTSLKAFARDTSGNSGNMTTANYAIDTIPPVITLRGSSPVSVQIGSTYTDAGATALDNVDGNITSSIVVSNPVNTSVLGTYTVTYNVKDAAGNSATQVTRTVNVVHTGPPAIYMQDITATFGLSVYSGRPIQAEYVTGSSALVGKQIDTMTIKLQREGSPTGNATIGVFNSDFSVKKFFGTINTSTIPTGYQDYTFTLPSLAQAYVIQSGDRIGIKFAGGNTGNLIDIMTDQNSADPFDGTRTYLTYFTDGWSSFTSNDLYMTLKLSGTSVLPSDTTPPAITLRGSTPVSVQRGSTYTDAGATALDNVDGNITSSIVVSNPVNTSVLGTYTVTYNVKDAAGNSATQVTRTVNVVDTIAPVSSASIPGGTYTSIQSVTLSSSEPSTIYYTTDASPPSTSSAVYNNPITIAINTTLKFFAKDTAGNSGTVVAANYTINTNSSLTASPTETITISDTVTAILANSSLTNSPTETVTASDTITPILAGASLTASPTETITISDTVTAIRSSSSVTYMNDTTATYGLNIYAGHYQTFGEYASPTSVLVGKSIDTMKLQLKKVGSPTGTVTVGIFDSSQNLKQSFGSFSISSLTIGYVPYSYSLPSGQTYTISSGDRIGLKYTGGDASNNLAIMTDQSNTFDNTNSYLSYYTTSWQAITGVDVTMALTSHPLVDTIPPVITLRGSSPVSVQIGSTYTDAGATALDNVDGNITSSIVVSNPVNTSVLGTYTVTYNVKDTAGNSATQVTRTVNVITTSSSPTETVTASDTITPILAGASLTASPTETITISDTVTAIRSSSSVTYMNDTTATYGLNIYAGHYQTFGEYASPTSVLVGKSIDTMKLQLKKVGSPTGTVTVGIFDSSQNLKQSFGSFSISSLTIGYVPYSYSLPSGQTYTISSGDRIGLKYTGGDASNNLAIMTDQSNTFDNTNSYLSYYTTSWQAITGVDVTMMLKKS